jgi:trimeric autotransporter adhesin
MKKSILLISTILFLAACKKETTVAPVKQTVPVSTTGQTPVTTKGQVTATTAPDTIPDNAALKIKLVKDSINYDETMFFFNHAAKLAYDPNNDSPYFAGFGQESLSSISSDGRDLVINTIPYSSGIAVSLVVGAKADGAFSLQVSYANNIPANIQILIQDNYTKATVDITSAPYKFNVVKADTTTYGSNRFKVIFKSK